jgi:NmrA-like family
VTALKGQDALIITLAFNAPPDTQKKLIEAAVTAGVHWIVPNEFGNDGSDDKRNAEIRVGVPKKAVREHIEKLGVSWIGISCGFWYEFSLAGGEARYGFDFKNKTVLFYDHGLTKIPTSTWPQTGRGVAKVLALKLLPEDESDKSTTLEDYRNKYVHFESFNINQQEMLESVLRVTGDKKSDWKIKEEPVQEYYKHSVEQLQKTGDLRYFGQLLYCRMFFPNENDTLLYGSDNEKLGLPKENLDDFTKIAVDMDKNGYF